MANGIELAKAYMQIVPTTKDFKSNLEAAIGDDATSAGEEAGDMMGSGVASGLLNAALTIANAAAEAFGAVIGAARDAAAELDEIDKASIRMGVSTDYFQELSYAAKLCGVSISSIERAAKNLEGSDISFEDAMNQILSIEDASERSKAACDLFGETVAYNMKPLLDEGASGMDEMRRAANDLGLVIDGETVDAGVKLNDTFTTFDATIGTLRTEVLAEFMPVIQGILDWVIENMPAIQAIVRDVIVKVKGFIALIAEKIDSLGIDWGKAWEDMCYIIGKAWEIMKPIFDVLLDAIGATIGKIAEMISAIATVMKWINGDSTAGLTDEIKRVNSGGSIFSPANWGNVPKMASGGVLEKGQIGFLEGDGAEAVVPLENNSKWISAVADEMQNQLYGSSIIERLENMQIVLDSGALVGGISSGIDQSLYYNGTVAGRSVAIA